MVEGWWGGCGSRCLTPLSLLLEVAHPNLQDKSEERGAGGERYDGVDGERKTENGACYSRTKFAHLRLCLLALASNDITYD